MDSTVSVTNVEHVDVAHNAAVCVCVCAHTCRHKTLCMELCVRENDKTWMKVNVWAGGTFKAIKHVVMMLIPMKRQCLISLFL